MGITVAAASRARILHRSLHITWSIVLSAVLDFVVNNAGFGDIAPFEQLSSERFKALYRQGAIKAER